MIVFVGNSVAVTPELVVSAGSDRQYHSATLHKLMVGRYRTLTDVQGAAPSASIARPLGGATLFERQAVEIRVDAFDECLIRRAL